MNFKSPNFQVIRRQGLWTLVWLSLFLVSFFYPLNESGPQKWISDQVSILAFALTLFQVGRVFEIALELRQGQGVSPISLEQNTPVLEQNTSLSTSMWPMRELKEYASLQEAQEHGWVFSGTEGYYNKQPIPQTAKFQDHEFEYVGLYNDQSKAVLEQNQRVFGHLCYQAKEVVSQVINSLPPANHPGFSTAT